MRRLCLYVFIICLSKPIYVADNRAYAHASTNVFIKTHLFDRNKSNAKVIKYQSLQMYSI